MLALSSNSQGIKTMPHSSSRRGRNPSEVETILVVGTLQGGFCAALARLENALRGVGARICPLVNHDVPVGKGDAGGGIMINRRKVYKVGVSRTCSGRYGNRTIIDGIRIFIHEDKCIGRSRPIERRHFAKGRPSCLAGVVSIAPQPRASNRRSEGRRT